MDQTYQAFQGRTTLKQIDEWTVEDTYHVLDKSEDQLLFEEMLAVSEPAVYTEDIRFY